MDALRWLRKLLARYKSLLLIICNTAQITSHQLIEEIIDCAQHNCTGTEIMIQFDLNIISFRLIPVVFFDKYLWTCHTETVDTLFHIAHHEHIMHVAGFARYCSQNILLQIIAVLILVNIDFLIPVCDRLSNLCRHCRSILVIAGTHKLICHMRDI